MGRAFTICLFFALCAGIKAVDFLTHPPPTDAPVTPTDDPIAHVVDAATFKAELDKCDVTIESIREQFLIENKKQRMNIRSPAIMTIITALEQHRKDLTETKDIIQRLTERLLQLNGDISGNHKDDIEHRLVKKAEAAHLLFDDIEKLLKTFDCKKKRAVFMEDLLDVKKNFHNILKQVSNNEQSEKCRIFKVGCTNTYKHLKEKLEDLLKDDIPPFDKEIHVLLKADCFLSVRQKNWFQKQITDLKARVKSWITSIKRKMKKAIEREFTAVQNEFRKDCDVLSELKVNIKDVMGDADEVTRLTVDFKPQMAALKQRSLRLNTRFMTVYNALQGLKDCLIYEDYKFCYDAGLEIYYMITSFHIQIGECQDALDKRVTLVEFENDVKEKNDTLHARYNLFKEKITEMKRIAQVNFCDDIADRINIFGNETFMVDSNDVDGLQLQFTKCNNNLKELQTKLETDLKDCEEFDAYKTTLDGMGDTLQKHIKNTEKLTCFLDIYNEGPCGNGGDK